MKTSYSLFSIVKKETFFSALSSLVKHSANNSITMNIRVTSDKHIASLFDILTVALRWERKHTYNHFRALSEQVTELELFTLEDKLYQFSARKSPGVNAVEVVEVLNLLYRYF